MLPRTRNANTTRSKHSTGLRGCLCANTTNSYGTHHTHTHIQVVQVGAIGVPTTTFIIYFLHSTDDGKGCPVLSLSLCPPVPEFLKITYAFIKGAKPTTTTTFGYPIGHTHNPTKWSGRGWGEIAMYLLPLLANLHL